MNTLTKGARPGLHSSVEMWHYSEIEKKIIKKLSKEWYVTNSGARFKLGGTSEYKYCLVKPTERYNEMFNLERELVVIFADFKDFQPRTLDAIEFAYNKLPDLRVEKICSIVFSNDPKVEEKIGDLLKQDQESQIIIPVHYGEYFLSNDPYYLENKFRKHFFTRDLFAFESPIKKDLYFFGRTDIIHKIVSRHQSNENSALFGLRKTGKTSVIFKIERTLEKKGEKSIWIDCQNTSFNQRRWNECLYYILYLLRDKYRLEIHQYCERTGAKRLRYKSEDQYTEKNAGLIFEKEILELYNILGQKSILLIFDEIERITFNIGDNDHWAKETDFIFLWQTLRSIFQKLNGIFSYLIVGTNSMCVEMPLINGKDNPLFNSVPFSYIERFDIQQTGEMVRKLGSFMGLKFDEIIFSKLTEDFGGHPFLIRHVCSNINSLMSSNRPVIIDRITYDNSKADFNAKSSGYFEMMLGILREYYSDEFSMLEYLALGDMAFFEHFAQISPDYTNHLIGYGIISKNNNNYDFKIDSIKDYLLQRNKYKKINVTSEEIYKEINERRNAIEPKIRTLIKGQMKGRFGEGDAKKKVLQTFTEEIRNKIDSLSFSEILNGDKNKYLMFLQLKVLVSKYWDVFQHIFDKDQKGFEYRMDIINTIGRSDTHSKTVSKEQLDEFRIAISWIEKRILDFEN
jgi:hypothetical protein